MVNWVISQSNLIVCRVQDQEEEESTLFQVRLRGRVLLCELELQGADSRAGALDCC